MLGWFFCLFALFANRGNTAPFFFFGGIHVHILCILPHTFFQLKLEDVRHLVVLSVYKEPLELLLATVGTLADQSPTIR